MKWWLLLIGQHCMEKLNFCTRPFWSNTFRIYNITRNCKSGNTEVKQQNIKQWNFEMNTPPCRSCTSRSLSRRWYNPPPSPWTPSHLRKNWGKLGSVFFLAKRSTSRGRALRFVIICHILSEKLCFWDIIALSLMIKSRGKFYMSRWHCHHQHGCCHQDRWYFRCDLAPLPT